MSLFRFGNDRNGGVAPLLALGAVPLMVAVGAGIDYSRANSARAAMQGGLDATALIMAKQGGGDHAANQATTYFAANFSRPEVYNISVTSSATPVSGGSSFALSAAGSINTVFLRIAGIPTLNLSVHSSAVVLADGLGCVLSLDKYASGATTGQGTTTVNLNGCSLYDNSNNDTALTVGGSARISALSVGVVGGLSAGSSDNITTMQGIRTGIGPVIDP